MKQQIIPSTRQNQYFLTRVKDTHEEGGMRFITLFARLTLNDTRSSQPKSLWVYIDEVKEDGAPSTIRALPNGVHQYVVSQKMAREILEISADNPQRLWLITPFHSTSQFREFEHSVQMN